jgi:hypothetical protein
MGRGFELFWTQMSPQVRNSLEQCVGCTVLCGQLGHS